MFKLLVECIRYAISREPDYGYSKVVQRELLLKICNVLAAVKLFKVSKTIGACNSWNSCPGDEPPYINFYFCKKHVFGFIDPDGECEPYYENYSDVIPF